MYGHGGKPAWRAFRQAGGQPALQSQGGLATHEKMAQWDAGRGGAVTNTGMYPAKGKIAVATENASCRGRILGDGAVTHGGRHKLEAWACIYHGSWRLRLACDCWHAWQVRMGLGQSYRFMAAGWLLASGRACARGGVGRISEEPSGRGCDCGGPATGSPGRARAPPAVPPGGAAPPRRRCSAGASAAGAPRRGTAPRTSAGRRRAAPAAACARTARAH